MPRSELVATVRRTTRLGGGISQVLDLRHGREVVPATWLTPARDEPAPAVLLLHGLSASREQMRQAVGRPLLRRGIASLAIDLPYHGERSSAGGALPKNPLALVGAWRTAIAEVRAAAAWLTLQPAVDASHLGVLGYSLGGFLALMAAADEPAVCAVALVAAGDLPDQVPYARLVRGAVDPLRAVRRLAGRPLQLVNGRRDTTTRPAQAERLFTAAAEPKRLDWYDGGHWPPPSAIESAVTWMVEQLCAESPTRAAEPR